MLCPEGDCNEAVLEELLFWLEGSMASQMVIVMTEKCAGPMHKILESIFSDKLEISGDLEVDDRIWVIKTVNERLKLGLSDEFCIKLSKEAKLASFEGLLALIAQSYPVEEGIDDVVSAVAEPSWMLVQGQEEAKERLLASARFLWDDSLLQKYLEVVHISPNLGILLHGPPGTGKTLLAKEIARLKNIHFHAVTIPELVHAEIGRSEQSLAEVFRLACARQPAILFIDELEAIFAGGRDTGEDQHTTGSKLLSQLMIEFDRLYSDEEFKRVLVIGATNRIDALDSSLLRFGRFGESIAVLPESGYNVPAKIIRKGLELLLNEGLVDMELITDGAIEAIIETGLGPNAVISGAEAAQILEDAKRSAMHSQSAVSKAILANTLSYYK